MLDWPLFGRRSGEEGTAGARRRVRAPRRLARAAVDQPVRAVAFWGAVALPAAYLPLLAMGLDGPGEARLFLGLVGLHVLALFVGRSYDVE